MSADGVGEGRVRRAVNPAYGWRREGSGGQQQPLCPLVNPTYDLARAKLWGIQGQEAGGSLLSSMCEGCLAPTLPVPMCPAALTVPCAQSPRNSPGAGVKGRN